MRRRALLGATALIGWVSPAQADPATIGAAIIATVNAFAGATVVSATATIAATGITIAQVVGTVAVVGGAIAASALMGVGQRARGVDPGQTKQTFTAEEAPIIRAVGRVRLGGPKVFGATAGDDRYRLILHAKALTYVEQYFLGGREVIVDEDGFVTSVPWAYSGGSYALLFEDDGDEAKTAWGALMTVFPEIWTSNHRARGAAQTLIRYKSPGLASTKFTALYSGGVPNLEKVARGEAIYDPRTGETTWSDNGILVTYHVCMALDDRLTVDDFDVATWISEANKADAPVATLTGVEPRARAWGVWSEETARSEVLRQVLDSIGAEQIMVGDKIAFRLIDDEPTVEAVIFEDHVIAVTDRAGPESVERPNVCKVKYYAEERNLNFAEIDMTGVSWARIDAEILTAGVQEMEVALPFCPSAAQAQRIARRRFAIARARSGMLTTNFAGIAVWGARYVAVPTPDGTSATALIGTPQIDDGAGEVTISYQEWPALTPWNPETDEALAPDIVPEIPIDTALSTPSAPTQLAVVQLLDGSWEARAEYTIVSGTAEMVLRVVPDTLRTRWAQMDIRTVSPPYPTPSWSYAAASGDFAGLDVSFKIRRYSGDDSSNWAVPVTWLAGTALMPEAPTIVLVDTNDDTNYDIVRITAPVDIACVGIHVAFLIGGVPNVSDHAVVPGGVIDIPLLFTGYPRYVGAQTIATLGGVMSDPVSTSY